jgi:serine/threonine-protein kinase
MRGSDMAQKILHQFGKYEVIEEVGRGGFGAVYKALDTTLDRAVALKVLAPHLVWEPGFVARFQQEARTAARLRHPNIVVIYEMGEIEGSYYMAMEYLPGKTLSQVIAERGKLQLDEVVAITKQLASALDYAHSQGVIHRDVKPSNVIISEDGHVTLTDFGLVKAADGTRLTTTGFFMGTPEYMSPEQCEPEKARALDHRCDIYALGIVVYEMCTGQVPFQGKTPLAVLRGHADKSPPPPSQLNPAITSAFEAALFRALAKDREGRYHSAGEFVQALEETLRASQEERQREEQLAFLYAKAKEALDENRWEEALSYCSQLMALKLGYFDIAEFLAKVSEGLMKERERREEPKRMVLLMKEKPLARLEEERRDVLRF